VEGFNYIKVRNTFTVIRTSPDLLPPVADNWKQLPAQIKVLQTWFCTLYSHSDKKRFGFTNEEWNCHSWKSHNE